MNEQEMSEYLKGKSQEEIREFIVDRLKKICEEGEKLSVNDEDYERAGELLEIKNRILKDE
jgi:predicted house-cleaning noncanonical NTP pyrophosphatase (MazG superfamily)